MASRVAGALLALIAAALLAVSVVAAAWWSGHPKFNGSEIKAKEIAVGPLGATGCNTGGDGACMSVPVDPTFETIGYALAGVTGLLALVALVLGVMTARGAAKRKSFAVFAIVGAMIAALLAVLLVVVGPKIRTEAPLPFSTGLFVFFGGVTAALASSVFAMRAREAAPPRMRLAPPRPSARNVDVVPVSPGGGFDVQALLSEDAGVRPSQPGPMNRNAPVQSPGGALPGPSGPLGGLGTGPQQPLFSSAPQLRPLYDAAPGQGGTSGFVPKPPTNMPMRPPTPVPRDQISAHAGIPTPASIEVQRSPVTMAGLSIPQPPSDATDRDLLGTARGVGKPKTLPPPNRNKSPSMPPMATPQPLPPPTPTPIPAPPKTLAAMAVPPPPNTTLATLPHLESDDEPFDAMKTYQKEPAPKPAPAPKARPSVPMPAKPKPTTPPPRAPTPRPPTRLLTEDASVDTDVSQQAIDDESPPTETFETATNESTSFSQKPRKPSSTMETQPAPSDSVDDEMMTVGREKVARTDVELPTVRPPTETSPSTPPAPDEDKPADHEKPTERALADHEKPTERAPTKVPISTAPDSLPPPTEKQAAASGPSPACPQCEAPMAWVEAHLRFYCKSCKMYF